MEMISKYMHCNIFRKMNLLKIYTEILVIGHTELVL